MRSHFLELHAEKEGLHGFHVLLGDTAFRLPLPPRPSGDSLVVMAQCCILVVQVQPAHRLVRRHTFAIDIPAFGRKGRMPRTAGNFVPVFYNNKSPARLVTARHKGAVDIDSEAPGFLRFDAIYPSLGFGTRRERLVLEPLLSTDYFFARIPRIDDLSPVWALDCIEFLFRF